jgi:hypothetical protein
VFNQEDAIAAVPTKWISVDSKTCKWPPKSQVNSIKNPNSSPGADWETCLCYVKGYYGNLIIYIIFMIIKSNR